MEPCYWIVGIVLGLTAVDLLISNVGQGNKRRDPMERPLGTVVGVREAAEGAAVSIVLKKPLSADEYIDLGDPTHVIRVTEMRDRNGQPAVRAEAKDTVTIQLPIPASQIMPGMEVFRGIPAPFALAVNGG